MPPASKSAGASPDAGAGNGFVDVEERLKNFAPIDLEGEGNTLDTAFADRFLKVVTRMAKAQMKIQQQVSFSVDEVKQHLDDRADLVDDLKGQRNEARSKNEQLIRFVLEVMDLITGFYAGTRRSKDSEMSTAAATMQEALEKHMGNVGLTRIPAIGEEADGLYHFVLDTRPAGTGEQADRIVEEVRPGYVLDGEVLRKADVIVGK